jgi:TetR/AcrR family transcriptional regulator, cholesterol catabolism regulator
MSERSTARARKAAPAAGRGRGATKKKRDDEVLDAAARVFARRGYADASVQDVADELGILKASLYHYIKMKEDLLFWLLEEVHKDVEVILEEVANAEGLAPLERIELYVKRQVLYNLDNLERISIYYHDMDRLSEARLSYLLGRRAGHERFMVGLVRQAQSQGMADPELDARLISNCIFATVIWTYRWYRPSGPIGRERIADECAEFALRGVIGNLDVPRPATPPRARRATARSRAKRAAG